MAERFTGKSKNTLGKEIEVKNDVPAFLENRRVGGQALEDDNLAFLQREANAGNLEAQFQLGRMYDVGDKLERDPQKAITWYTSAANQGYDKAQYRLAIVYLYGVGTTKNVRKGEDLLSQAAKQNHPVASKMLPIYLANRSSNTSTSIALSWYLEKVARNEPGGNYGIGYMYENGWGLNPNTGEAKKWYAVARTAGSGGAAKRLRQIKAVAASNDPDPSEASRPKLPENFNTQSIRQSASTIPDREPMPSSVSQQESRQEFQQPARSDIAPKQVASRMQNQSRQASTANSEPSSPVTFSATITRRSPLTPVILVLFGIVMGITVFKWMRRSSYKNTMF